jgi:hypothetical protein
MTKQRLAVSMGQPEQAPPEDGDINQSPKRWMMLRVVTVIQFGVIYIYLTAIGF